MIDSVVILKPLLDILMAVGVVGGLAYLWTVIAPKLMQ